MSDTPQLLIGGNDNGLFSMDACMANRHGLIAGATGTGKTITLQTMAENFSRLGVPVFLADVKGDLSGLAAKGKPHPKIDARVKNWASKIFSRVRCLRCSGIYLELKVITSEPLFLIWVRCCCPVCSS